MRPATIRTPAETLEWMTAGTDLFGRRLAALRNSEFAMPSPLPGWSRAHLVGHVARNACALRRLLDWARTGVETPMYPDPGARAREIEETAAFGPPALRDLIAATAAELAGAARDLPGPAWRAEVRTAQGRVVPASEVPWMRTREVWVHAVDLANGAAFADFPADLLDAFLDDIVATRQRRSQHPAIVVAPTDRGREWRVDFAGEDVHVLRGTAAELTAALTGRARPPGIELGVWL